MLLVQGRDIDGFVLDDPVVGAENGRDRGEEDSQARHEGQQGGGAVDDLPRYHYLGSSESSNDGAALDVDIFGKQGRHVVGVGYDISAKVGADLSDDPSEADEEGASSARRTVPLGRKRERVLDVFAVYDFGCRCADDAKKAEHNGYERKEENLPVDALRLSEVSCEIGDVRCYGCPIKSTSQYLQGVLVELRECVLPRLDLIVKEHLPTACHR
jgi:hypothetical protein